jgi:hypothetical protein
MGGAIALWDTGQTVTIKNSTFENNRCLGAAPGGAIYNYSTTKATALVISNSTFKGNSSADEGSGAVGTYPNTGGTLTVSNSLFTDNRARSGGAIGTGRGDVTVTNTTFDANRATVDDGGAVYLGVVSGTPVAQFTNVTFSNNTAIPWAGAIRSEIPITYRNTIFLGNSISGGGNVNCYGNGAITSAGRNIEDRNDCLLTDLTDRPSTAALLGTLQNNGGPTHTRALDPLSPGVDQGVNAGCPATDQRGYARPVGGTCDSGAFELQ